MTRREILPALAACATIRVTPAAATGRLKQTVTSAPFRGSGMQLDDMARVAAEMGFYGFDLVGAKDFPVLKKHGLIPSMVPVPGMTIADGINDPANHDRFEKGVADTIDAAAGAGAPNVIILSGNRRGMPDAQGADHCVAFFNRVKRRAEDKRVTLCMELLNSKVDHKDYMCDHSWFGAEVCRRVDSPRVKLLYDIYHMQIMEGDIVRTVRDNIGFIGHFHTGGNPGRHEIDGTQELNYRFVASAIADAGFAGYVAHEYTPAVGAQWRKSLQDARAIFTV
jgi:hydroxypyruvate isomerase